MINIQLMESQNLDRILILEKIKALLLAIPQINILVIKRLI